MFTRKATVVFILVLLGISAALAVNDPARDYLSTFSPPDGDKAIYSSDTLLRLELDLDGDGQNEVLLSMARDQSGKLGNVWTVYAKVPTGYKKVGTMTFDPKSFYLGPIDELGDYGLVTFRPTGDGKGSLFAYLFNGVTLHDVEITSVTPDAPTRDAETDRPMGQAIVDKYKSQAADAADALTPINAGDLAKKYDLKVAGDQQTASVPLSIASPLRSETESSRSILWTLFIVIPALVAIGVVIWAKRR